MRAIVETGYKGYVAQEFIPERQRINGVAEVRAWRFVMFEEVLEWVYGRKV